MLFLCALLLTVVGLFVCWVIVLEFISYSTNLISTVLYTKRTHKIWAKTAAYAIQSNFYEILAWFSWLYLCLKAALLFRVFQTNLFILLSYPPDFSLFL